MMKLEKVKGFLDWVAHGKLIFDLVVSGAGAKLSKALLVSFTRIPELWRTPIEWFCGALILGILLYVGRNRGGKSLAPTPETLVIQPYIAPPWEGYESEEAWRAAIAEQNRLVSLAHSVEGLLNPLQIEVIALRKELMGFVSQCGPFPEPPTCNDRILRSLEWSNKFVAEIVDWAARYSIWSRKITFGYREKFAPKVLRIMNEVGAKTTIDVDALEPYVSDLGPREDFANLITVLQKIVWKLDQTVPFPQVNEKIKRLIWGMTPDELLAALRDPTLKKVIDEMPPE